VITDLSAVHKSLQLSQKHTILNMQQVAHCTQSNGQAERMVQTVKKILRQSNGIHKGLLVYRSTPIPWCNLSPAELLMGQRLRTQLSCTDNQLIP